MNRNEVEQWMKESLGSMNYAPGEDNWKKLQEAITPPAKKNYLLLLGALPAGWKAAATVVLLISVGSLVYLLDTDKKNTNDKTAGKVPNIPITIPAEKEHAIPPAEKTEDYSPTPSGMTAVHKSRKPLVKPPHSPVTIQSIQPVPETQPSKDDPVPPPIAHDQTEVAESQVEILPRKPVSNKQDVAKGIVEDRIRENNRLNLGISAQAGKASVGNMRYQFGLVAQKNIAGNFYLNATLALASTDVTSSQQNTFQSISVNSVGAGIGSTVDEKTVEAQYGRSVISVGISPNIGYRMTRRLAISAGLSLYRNLDQSLTLQNEDDLDKTALSNNVISDSKSIGKWDAGMTGNVSYDISKQLSVDVQYRYGLSNYMYFNDQAIRNSGASMGLHYLFGRK